MHGPSGRSGAGPATGIGPNTSTGRNTGRTQSHKRQQGLRQRSTNEDSDDMTCWSGKHSASLLDDLPDIEIAQRREKLLDGQEANTRHRAYGNCSTIGELAGERDRGSAGNVRTVILAGQ